MQQKSDNVVSHYVFKAPVRIWHWLTVLCMAVFMVTGYFIGKPLPSVSEATYPFYMGYIRLIHFSAGMVFTVVLLMRIHGLLSGIYSSASCLSCRYGVKLVAGRVVCNPLVSVSGKRPSADISHNPIAQVMFGYFLMSVFYLSSLVLRCTANTASTLFCAVPLCGGIFLTWDGWQLNGHSQLASAGDVADRRVCDWSCLHGAA
ncbi:cytochrome b/b6 domain-containing protein [Shigella flexneri]